MVRPCLRAEAFGRSVVVVVMRIFLIFVRVLLNVNRNLSMSGISIFYNGEALFNGKTAATGSEHTD